MISDVGQLYNTCGTAARLLKLWTVDFIKVDQISLRNLLPTLRPLVRVVNSIRHRQGHRV